MQVVSKLKNRSRPIITNSARFLENLDYNLE